LNADYDPSDTAFASVPVPSDSIAAAVEFVTEVEVTVADIADMKEWIAAWPGIMAHVRLEQRHTASRQARADDDA
jgi:hypothetical protein